MITLPEKLASMTPYDPCEDVYQIKLDANESDFSLPEELRDAIAASIDAICSFDRYPDARPRGGCPPSGGTRISHCAGQYCRRKRFRRADFL